jgi:hypothetical protein
MVRLAPVPASALPDAWPHAAPLIALACARSSGKFLPQDVARAVAEHRFQLWLGLEEGCPRAGPAGPDPGGEPGASALESPIRVMLLTRLLSYPRLRVCEVLACVGDDRPAWEPLLDHVEAWARAQGCALMQPIARPGWERVLAKRGYRKTHVMLEKKL